MTIEVVGAGFGRTGTDSMREALSILGFGPCHHMLEVLGNEDQKALWREVAAGGPADWERLFSGYRSCVDWPSAYYWREIADFYPDAKVILTHRSAESWWASFSKTILPVLETSTDPRSLGLALITAKVFGGRPGDKDNAIAAYEAGVRAVKETVAPDRLLVHELGDGWDPLCTFLGVSVPDEPYPDRNAREAFVARAAKRAEDEGRP